MKKRIGLLITLVVALAFSSAIYAANEYSFDLTYQGDVIVNQEKNAVVSLKGTNAPVHSKVRIKVEVTGPATPTITAVDSANNTINILETGGFWGPVEGFAVGGTFSNDTPIKATFPQAGSYAVKLSLLDLENSNSVITTKDFNITVTAESTGNNVVENNTINNIINNTVNEIPKAGTAIWEYALYTVAVVGVLCVIFIVARKKN